MVAWRSVRQSTITLSTAEAEIIALTFCAREAIGMRNLLCDIFGHTAKSSIIIGCDNIAACLIGSGQASVRKVRHLDLSHLYIRELATNGEITIEHVPGVDNPANLLTKILRESEMKSALSMVQLVE